MKIDLSESEVALLIKCVDSAIMSWISHRTDPLPGKINEKRRLEGVLLNKLKERFFMALLKLSEKKGEKNVEPKVNIKSNFSKSIVERVFDESVFMLENDAILKTTAAKFKVSTTTVWRDMRERLQFINAPQYRKIGDLINSHKGK